MQEGACSCVAGPGKEGPSGLREAGGVLHPPTTRRRTCYPPPNASYASSVTIPGDPPALSVRGGYRRGTFRATYPFATLRVDESSLQLGLFWMTMLDLEIGEQDIAITAVAGRRNSGGLRFAGPGLPDGSMNFWVAGGLARLVAALRGLGWHVG